MRARRYLVAATALLGLACAASEATPDAGGAAEVDAGAPADAGAPPPRALCVDGVSVDGAYPGGEHGYGRADTLPELSFEARAAGGATTTISMRAYFEPCAPSSRLLAIRIGAAWCGTCAWSAAHLAEGLDAESRARVLWLDVLVRDEDNGPATLEAAAAWASRVAAPGAVAVDPTFSLAPFAQSFDPLPLYVLVDTRRMTILSVSGELTPSIMVERLRRALASLDRLPRPASLPEELHDGLFDRREWSMLQDMAWPVGPPPDPTNAVADDPLAAELGRTLFSEPALSPGGTISCALCHDAARGFADGRPTSLGLASGDRNAPSVALASHARWQFWDGRADTLWAQATGPFENPTEFGSSRLFVAHRVAQRHRSAYEAIFGSLPPLDDAARFPAAGRPGDAAYDAMAPGDREAVTRVLANVGKAIAAFERTIRVKPNRLDAYVRGQTDALTAIEKRGASTFFVAGCAQCHFGPRLTNDAFHDVRFPSGRQDGAADRGRAVGLELLPASPFRADGLFSDAPAGRAPPSSVPSPWLEGAFRTPPLRGVPHTAPYGHGGSLATLREVVELYGDRGLAPEDPRALGPTEPWVAPFADDHIEELVEFLEVLEAEPE